MVGMPYLLLAVGGFLVYRGLKRRAALTAELARRAAGDQPPLPGGPERATGLAPGEQGALSCSAPSTGAGS
jgi:hypothetical protein